ncbi:MAG: hypothetical protein IAG13_11975, partial [Deltaproteobacteria bacterium]|nr:hypothetical protein [Nannocystaceae bacterium]
SVDESLTPAVAEALSRNAELVASARAHGKDDAATPVAPTTISKEGG